MNKTTEPAALARIEPVAWIMRNGTLIYQHDHILARSYDWKPLYSATTVELLVQEQNELDKLYGLQFNENNDLVCERKTLKEQLAASKAREQQLREALEFIVLNEGMVGYSRPYDEARAALALPQDDTALKAWGAKVLRDAADDNYLRAAGNHVTDRLRRMADTLEQTK